MHAYITRNSRCRWDKMMCSLKRRFSPCFPHIDRPKPVDLKTYSHAFEMPCIILNTRFDRRQSKHTYNSGLNSSECSMSLTRHHLLLDGHRAGEKTVVVLLCVGSNRLPFCPPPPLLEQPVSCLGQKAHLSVLDAGQPVTEACADAGVHGVCPERLTSEEGTHFDAELPYADGDAC